MALLDNQERQVDLANGESMDAVEMSCGMWNKPIQINSAMQPGIQSLNPAVLSPNSTYTTL